MSETEAAFPWSLAEEVFDLLQQRQARILRYCDLKTEASWCGSRWRYLDEFIRFHHDKVNPITTVRTLARYGFLRWGTRYPALDRFRAKRYSDSAGVPTVIIQHDADLLPERTLEMMDREKRRGLVSSNYFFVRHADEVPYQVDVQRVQEFERQGFEIGYHQNAYERSGYDLPQAYEIASQDLQWMQERFNIRSFVPHGGTPSPQGLNNDHLPHAGALKPFLWAYNGKCILKEYTWSDGGIKKWTPMDPREFVMKLAPNSRAMMLMHPQYYGDSLRPDWESLPISRHAWWRRLWGIESQ
jgi:hypothetical protein